MAKKWKSMSIPESIWEKVTHIIEKEKLYTNPTDFIIDAVRRRLEELEKIVRVNMQYHLTDSDIQTMGRLMRGRVLESEDGIQVTLWEKGSGKEYDVYVSPGPDGTYHIFCEGCKSFSCPHTKYVYFVVLGQEEEKPKQNYYVIINPSEARRDAADEFFSLFNHSKSPEPVEARMIKLIMRAAHPNLDDRVYFRVNHDEKHPPPNVKEELKDGKHT